MQMAMLGFGFASPPTYEGSRYVLKFIALPLAGSFLRLHLGTYLHGNLARLPPRPSEVLCRGTSAFPWIGR